MTHHTKGKEGLNKATHITNNVKLDRCGATVSLACAVHCAVMPLAVGLLPLLGLCFLADEQTEWAFVIVALGLGVASLLPSYLRRHQQARPLLLFGGGTCLLLGARLFLAEESPLELPAAVLGALLLAGAHLINRRLCQACSAC
jgi:hypothetical protein